MKKIVICLVGLFLFNSLSFAQIIDVKTALSKKKAVLVSARNASDYAKVHIKNAVNIDIHTLQVNTPYKGKLKTPAQLAEILGNHGITRETEVIIYDDGQMKYAGRLYWVMKYLGMPNVTVLNGGMKSWMKARKPITKVATKTSKVKFTPAVNKNIIATKAYVKANLNKSSEALIDARSPKEFGEGSITKAINIEFKELTANGVMKSKADLQSLFQSKGITEDKEVIVFCATSVRAGIVYLALHDILKYANVKVYEGAYNEWKM